MYFTDQWAAERTGKHRTTIMRWRQSQTWPPELVRLAELELDGAIGGIHADWEGWTLNRRSGEICAPASRLAFRPGHLLAIPLHAQIESALRRQIEGLKSNTLAYPDHRRSGRRVRFVSDGSCVCAHCGASDRRRSSRADPLDVRGAAARWAR